MWTSALRYSREATSIGMEDQRNVRMFGMHVPDDLLRVRQAELRKLCRRQMVRP